MGGEGARMGAPKREQAHRLVVRTPFIAQQTRMCMQEDSYNYHKISMSRVGLLIRQTVINFPCKKQ